MKKYIFLIAITSLFFGSDVIAQIPVEVVVGDKKASIDLMFFKFFKNMKEENTKFLFFSRARSTVDYKMTSNTYLPSFGLTEAVSYNHPMFKGFAPVAVLQIFNRGVFPKVGIQYARLRKNFVFFTWLVCETLSEPDLDYFLLIRYTPSITEKLNFYTQFESNNAIPTQAEENFNFIQRIRVGLMLKSYQFGLAIDCNQIGNKVYTNIFNTGGFVRHEF